MSENQEIPLSPAEIDWYIDRYPYRGRILMSAYRDGKVVRSQIERILQMTASREQEMKLLGDSILNNLNSPKYWGKGPHNFYNKSS